MDNKIRKELIRKVVQNNLVEKIIQKGFEQKKISGSAHLSLGQEAVDVGVISACSECMVYGNHRSHGQYLAITDDIEGLLCELYNGVGGSQHLYFPGKFMSNGIQGGMAPIAFGHAFGIMMKKLDKRILCFVGDGTFGEGVLYEVLNLLTKFQVPLSIIVIDNKYAISETVGKVNIQGLAEAFGISYLSLTAPQDVFQVYNEVNYHFKLLKNSPSIIHAICPRLCGHSVNDVQMYRSKEEKTVEYLDALTPMCILSEVDIVEVKKSIELKISESVVQWELSEV